MNKATAIKNIIETMCKHGFMSGMLGDISAEFQKEQRLILLNMDDSQLQKWITSNRFNLVQYCGLAHEVVFLCK